MAPVPINSQDMDPVMCCDCGLFMLDMVGRFPRDRIRVIESPARRTSNAQVDAIIDKTWAAQLASAQELGYHLYDGRLHRLVEHRCQEGVLTLTLGRTSFKEFLGTNLTHSNLRHLYGTEVLSDVLGVSAAVCTSDGYILLGRRSKKVASHAGQIHAIGGVVESDGPAELPPHPTDVIARELCEELGILPTEIRSSVCWGLVRDMHIVQPELIFDVQVDADVPRLKQFQPPPEHQEHSQLVPVRDNPSAVVSFIEQNYSELTPVAQATLLLHGLAQWGSGWFASTRGYLRGVV